MRRLNIILYLACLLLVVSSRVGSENAPKLVTIRVDRSAPVGVSRLELGITHTQNNLDAPKANPQAVARVKRYLADVCLYQVTPIMGWGVDNPQPAPGVYQWETLDRRMQLIHSMGAVPILTLCAAPDWMKGGEPAKTDWSKIEVAPVPEHYGDFAMLAKQVAQRYPQVHYYQVWNEFKGFWDAANNNWDYRRYTQLYNQVYDALKSVNPAIQVGGPYLVLEGSGTNPHEWWGGLPLSARNQQTLDYWLQHKRGADFLVVDRSALDTLHDPRANGYTQTQKMALARYFGDIVRQLHARTSLPVWWAEYYGCPEEADPNFTAAQFALIYAQMAKTGVPQRGFLWGFLQEEGGGYSLFSKIETADGGQPTPHYRVWKCFHDAFAPGTRLYRAVSSSADVEALACTAGTLLLNKRSAPVIVRIDGKQFRLKRYEVRFVEVKPKGRLEGSANRIAH